MATSMDMLPTEILETIFVIGQIPPYPFVKAADVEENVAFALTISWVCTRWREIALAQPNLWTSIASRYGSTSTVLSFLQRSRDLPLVYSETTRPWSPPSKVDHLRCKIICRAQHCHLFSPGYFPFNQALENFRGSPIESLSIVVDRADVGHELRILRRGFSRLRRLHIDGYSMRPRIPSQLASPELFLDTLSLSRQCLPSMTLLSRTAHTLTQLILGKGISASSFYAANIPELTALVKLVAIGGLLGIQEQLNMPNLEEFHMLGWKSKHYNKFDRELSVLGGWEHRPFQKVHTISIELQLLSGSDLRPTLFRTFPNVKDAYLHVDGPWEIKSWPANMGVMASALVIEDVHGARWPLLRRIGVKDEATRDRLAAELGERVSETVVLVRVAQWPVMRSGFHNR
ncbi:hypothetical protein CYLTODRAFT_441974 [Cylindrobasidium torrendii FP15055 ss-10]|uniref:Uncharacterized protein n=1 Tax=Cylindrobasidium torrendii FP15055 ss-10 TaxID=1314674 RepID=A0A0D7BJV8_9AGAR|nr:hypothetical protein CYLTODRAFT_441974 [Cylindrobasidium torrendii FP15055 ss-10]